MKSWTNSLMIAAAALTVAAGSAAAQTYKAEIPIAFRAGETVMAPGSYNFKVTRGLSGNVYIALSAADRSSAVLLVPIPGSDAPKAWRKAGAPKISLSCVGKACSLDRLWDAQDLPTYQFRSPKLPAAERLAVVTFSLTRTE